MFKKYIFPAAIALTVIALGVLFFLTGRQPEKNANGTSAVPTDYKPAELPAAQTENNNPGDCAADCGRGGWERMRETCAQPVITKDNFKHCWENFNWTTGYKDIAPDKIESGYIEIGGRNILKNPTPKTIKVFIYIRWAADKDGNFYLKGEIG